MGDNRGTTKNVELVKILKMQKDTVNSNYWRDIEKLQKALNRKEEIQLSTSLKNDILSMIEKSLTESNYLVAKLLIYGHVDKPILLNFLFYISINTKILYNMFIDNPDKFGRKFMFNITPGELPKFESYFTKEEKVMLEDLIELSYRIEKIEKIEKIDNKQLKSLFPKSYKHNIRTNAFIRDNTL